MTKSLKSQRGSIHIVIIVVLILVILGTLGIVLWNDLHKKTQTSSTNVASTTKTVVSAPQYVDLDDWSVKFTLPTGLKMSDIVDYKTHVGEAPDYYGFTTSRVQAQGDECNNQVSGNLVVLNRSTTQQTGMGTPINSKLVGGYYYYLDDTDGGISPVPTCLTTSIAVQDHALLDKLVQSLVMDGATITIKELGVSIIVPDSIKDLTYYYDGSSDGVTNVGLSTATLIDEYKSTGGCTASNTNGPALGWLAKINGQYSDTAQYSSRLVKQFSTYYIGFTTPQDACADNQGSDVLTDLQTLEGALPTVSAL